MQYTTGLRVQPGVLSRPRLPLRLVQRACEYLCLFHILGRILWIVIDRGTKILQDTTPLQINDQIGS